MNCMYSTQGVIDCAKSTSTKTNSIEHFANNSCYGAKDGTCNSCDDVVNAYKKRNWAYNKNNFEQCRKSTSCYGAKDGTCTTCQDVINAYKQRGWAYNKNNFDQCK